ncbi:Plant transposase [Abeliophyllum distichum]|uniref:Plant transposase n=1 Tax=Abeliophyllum distichum TaxID=126358 RepID=A0ABD1NZC8_9LAMI
MEAAEKNNRNREQVGPPHRTGRRSCANIRREVGAASKPIDKVSVWIEMRKDAAGNPKDKDTADFIEQFNEKIDEALVNEEDSVELRDCIFAKVVGDDGHGHIRTMGSGVTPLQLNHTKKCS